MAQFVCSPWHNRCLRIFSNFLNAFNIEKLGEGNEKIG